MTKIKKGDFIELDYTGIEKGEEEVFDTTEEKVAKDNDIYEEEHDYEPVTVVVGEEQLPKGLDKGLIGKEKGDHEFELKPEEAFGKKDAKLIQLISTNKFKKEGVQPVPGLQVNIDGSLGTIRTVSGGRTIVDFNHPLAGKEVLYKVRINKVITDKKKKIESYLSSLELPDFDVKLKEKKAKIKVKQEIPEEIQKKIKEKLKELTGTEVEFEVEEESKKKEEKD